MNEAEVFLQEVNSVFASTISYSREITSKRFVLRYEFDHQHLDLVFDFDSGAITFSRHRGETKPIEGLSELEIGFEWESDKYVWSLASGFDPLTCATIIRVLETFMIENFSRLTATNHIFAFWQSDSELPGYLQLCVDTWYANIPNLQVHYVDHQNLDLYLPGVYPLSELKKISFPKQSDAISAALLEKYGGLFLDLDTVVLKNVFADFQKFEDHKLIAFGYPPNRGVHVAVLYCGKPGNPILTKWREENQRRLTDLSQDKSWNYFGSGIIEPLMQSKEHKDDFHLIDAVRSRNILEGSVIKDKVATASYEHLYFNDALPIDVAALLQPVTHGMISLHNSWTPTAYSRMSKSDFLGQNIVLARIFQSILHPGRYRRLNRLYHYVLEEFCDRVTVRAIRKFFTRDLLVIDFIVDGHHFAYDCKIADDNGIDIDLVLRNQKALQSMKTWPGPGNKSRLDRVHSDESLLISLFQNYQLAISKIS